MLLILPIAVFEFYRCNWKKWGKDGDTSVGLRGDKNTEFWHVYRGTFQMYSDALCSMKSHFLLEESRKANLTCLQSLTVKTLGEITGMCSERRRGEWI